MAPLSLPLSVAVLLIQTTVAFNCSKAPIYVDIHKRAVQDSTVFQYGSFIGIGGTIEKNTAQNQSLWPSLSQNHTSFASRSYCDNSTLRDCIVSTGGFFNPDLSPTFQELNDFQTLDKGDNASLKGFFGRDTLRLYTHYFETDGAMQTLVENTTVEVAESGSARPGVVGIGQDSTLLRDLASRDLIGARTYSLYIGQGMDRAGGVVNGSNVFGGYDSGRFTGPAHRYSMNLQRMNPMTVRVKDIVIAENREGGGNVSLFDPSAFPSMTSRPETFEAELTTDQYPLSLPYDITQNFISHLDAEPDNTWEDNSLKLKNPFNGTLSIVLEDGFTVTLPPEVLMNASNITPIQERNESATTPFYLSAAFLGQVYLMADFESNAFFLAKAVQKNNVVMPETFCPKSTPEAWERPKQSAWQKQGLIGAVVGGVIGGLGIAIFGYFFLIAYLRKREERKEEKELERGQKAKIAQFEVEDAPPEFDPPPKTATPFLWKRPW
ncbi:acid protease [Corynespora cassiicola Philippines]|uniref:Acid protease n=1 Tax=Corynespora cassiicola Philippines TaxID=1448308 RepID=A0A2T2P8T4_CORCC|nr:acid protease [Corynespora cassiicola Philippines]